MKEGDRDIVRLRIVQGDSGSSLSDIDYSDHWITTEVLFKISCSVFKYFLI